MASRMRSLVIPAAGRGTRLLPVTKVTPKELLNVYDRPVLQFAMDEAIALDVERIVVVIHPDKPAIREYLAQHPFQVKSLSAEGKTAFAAALTAVTLPDRIEIVFVEQTHQLGLGHAVLCAKGHMLPGPFGVILPDDLILGTPCLQEMARHYAGGHMIAAQQVTAEETSSYGIFRVAGPASGRTIPVSGMVEKPFPDEAPSRLAAVGRYILDPCIFDALQLTGRGAGGEIQLTDAIAQDFGTVPITAFRYSGDRHDCGSFDGLMSAARARQNVAAGRAPGRDAIREQSTWRDRLALI